MSHWEHTLRKLTGPQGDRSKDVHGRLVVVGGGGGIPRDLPDQTAGERWRMPTREAWAAARVTGEAFSQQHGWGLRI